MTLSFTGQRKSEVILQIACKIRDIRHLTGWNQTELAAKLGVTRETINKGVAEKSGSTQLLCGLEMLLELETLKRSSPPKSLPEQIADMQNRIKDLEADIRGKYPEPRSGAHVLNEKSVTGTTKSDAARLDEQAAGVSSEKIQENVNELGRRLKAHRKKATGSQ